MIDHDPLILLDGNRVRASLPMPELIAAVAGALSDTRATAERSLVRGEHQDWLLMPAPLDGEGLLCKLVRWRHGADDGSPTVAGVVVVLDERGALRAVVDGAALTAARTAAIAASVADRLARAGAGVLALFGTGALAEPHIEAMHAVRPLSEIRVVGRSPERTDAFVARMREAGWPIAAHDRSSALRGADLVVTVTTAPEPVFDDRDLEAGAHISAMGAHQPDQREIPGATVARAKLVVERRAGALADAGDIVLARAEGLIGDGHIVADLTEGVDLATLRAGDPEAVTMFKSIGQAALDVAAVQLLLARAARPAM